MIPSVLLTLVISLVEVSWLMFQEVLKGALACQVCVDRAMSCLATTPRERPTAVERYQRNVCQPISQVLYNSCLYQVAEDPCNYWIFPQTATRY
ncbi:hypothetical protein D3C78_1550640 [compost metagenome]